MKLGHYLIQQGLLRQDQVQVALRDQQRHYRLFGEICLELQFVKEEALLAALSLFHQLPSCMLRELVLQGEIVQFIPKELAESCQAILIGHQEGRYLFAMVDPGNLRLTDPLQNFCGRDAQLSFQITTAQQIQEAINIYYPVDSARENEEIRAIEIIQEVLSEAITHQASDIHLRPETHTISIWYRVDGVLHERRSLHKEVWDGLRSRLKILSSANLAESRRPQTGSFQVSEFGRTIDCRISFHPTIYGENVVIRLLDPRKTLFPLTELGFTDQQQTDLQVLMQMPNGLILLSGPTGCGKTTTLYALLTQVDVKARHVMTLEDPVEYHLPQIRQTEIIPEIMDFAEGVRSLLRQDPDVIFLSEIRDNLTAIMALRAALTGHLVLATIHASDNLMVIHRLQELGVMPQSLAGLVRGLLTQRLVRRLCPLCGGVGCPTCYFYGFKGRVAIAEILWSDLLLHQALAEGGSWDRLMSWRQDKGVQTLGSQAQALIEQGITTEAEIKRVYQE
jgi:type II secretory ATPase GspE/PulE/Tfp pilus assembly ATPase PilB-like protein